MNDWFDELSEFLRIESISAQPEHHGDVVRAGQWVCDFIRDAGGQAEVLDWNGHPLVVGEIAASADPELAPTVLCYGHFDVQPPDPLELWESPPFEPEIRDGYLYGRGSVDDKGQLYMLLAGARRLATESKLKVNVRFACDGEEEVGGSSIVEFIAADERGADAAVIFDSGLMADERPVFDVATRGWVYFHVELSTGAGDLHSGEFGGAAMNAAHALMSMLSSLTAKRGRLVEPLRAGALPLTAAELAEWEELTSGARELELQGATGSDPLAAEEFYLRTTAEPALDVNGFHSGSPYVQKTVLPVNAAANVSIRLAPGQRPEAIAAAFRQLLTAATPAGAKLTLSLLSTVEPGLVDASAEAIGLAQDAFERVLGKRPALIRVGGTLPIVAAFQQRGIPAIITGLSLPDAKVHAPNENIPAANVTLGIETAGELFETLSRLPGPTAGADDHAR